MDTERDTELKTFAIYFKTYYLNNKESWAYSYRLHLEINTNMYLKRIQRT